MFSTKNNSRKELFSFLIENSLTTSLHLPSFMDGNLIKNGFVGDVLPAKPIISNIRR